MKIDNQWIKYGMEALCEAGIVKDSTYKKEFKGYIASLGAAIVQSGLLPAMIFFGNQSASAEGREKVEEALRRIVWKARESKKVRFGESSFQQSLAYYLLELDEQQNGSVTQSDFMAQKEMLYRDVLKAAVALKLALRLFSEKQTQRNDGKQ